MLTAPAAGGGSGGNPGPDGARELTAAHPAILLLSKISATMNHAGNDAVEREPCFVDLACHCCEERRMPQVTASEEPAKLLAPLYANRRPVRVA